jgi:ribonuclease HI
MLTEPTATRGWFDAGLDPEGRTGIGFVVVSDDHVVANCAAVLEPGRCSDSMAAEFAALDALLRYLVISEPTGPIVIRGDCASVLALAQGQCEAGECYQRHVERIMIARSLLPPIAFEWISRAENAQAHMLARAALRHYRSMNPQSKPTSEGPTPAKARDTKAKLRRKARQVLSRIIDRL